MGVKALLKKALHSGALILILSAGFSKILGLFKDRLLVSIWDVGPDLDVLMGAFRIPDFFFALLVSGTVASILIPRMADAKKEEETKFFSSFFWFVLVFFGFFCLLGVIFAEPLTGIFVSGFAPELKVQVVPIARILFGSVFLLALSSVFGAYLQGKHVFYSIALAPILYMGSIVTGLGIWRDDIGILIVPFAAVAGALLHFLMNATAYLIRRERIEWVWKSPAYLWKGLVKDMGYRMANSSVFQLNLTMDTIIASFLMVGAVTSTSIGSNLGHVLMTIVGIPVARAAFPKLALYKKNKQAQRKIVKHTLWGIAFLTIPFSLLTFTFGRELLGFLFNLSGQGLEQTYLVFWPTILSLPFACSIPILNRLFLANDDTKTPLRVSILTLSIATPVAAILALMVFPPDMAILGLGIGNFIANTGSVLFLAIFTRKLWRTT